MLIKIASVIHLITVRALPFWYELLRLSHFVNGFRLVCLTKEWIILAADIL